MIVDTSALLAILFRESGYEQFLDAMACNEHRHICAVSVLEAVIVLAARKHADPEGQIGTWLTRLGIESVPFTPEMARIAAEAYLAFGKGRHPARLNFGDCCAYALARASGQPLLYKGDDFARTDIASVLPRA